MLGNEDFLHGAEKTDLIGAVGVLGDVLVEALIHGIGIVGQGVHVQQAANKTQEASAAIHLKAKGAAGNGCRELAIATAEPFIEQALQFHQLLGSGLLPRLNRTDGGAARDDIMNALHYFLAVLRDIHWLLAGTKNDGATSKHEIRKIEHTKHPFGVATALHFLRQIHH